MAGPAFAQPVTWLGTTNSDWNTPTNWSPAGVPGVTADVTVPPAAPAVTITTVNVTVASLNLGRQLTVATGRTLTVTTATVSATLSLANTATLSGGTYTFNPGGGLTFPAPCAFGRLSNITINGNLTVTNAGIRWNNVTNNGTLTLTGDSRIAFEGNQSLTGTIVGNTTGTISLEQATAGILTIAPTAIIRGGDLSFVISSCFNVAMSVVNNGTIQADVAARTITSTVALTNNGTITAGPGAFIASSSVVNNGTLNSTAGSITINGTVNPLIGTFTGTNFTFGGVVDLVNGVWTIGANSYRINGTLQNGTVNVSATNLTFPAPCTFGRLNNITINGNLTVNSGGIRWNNVTNNGTITLTGDARIAFDGDQTLTGTIVGNTTSTVLLQQATAGILTIAPSAIIRGGDLSFGSGSCFVVAMSIVNNGTIQADVAARTITSPVALTNNGTITAGPGAFIASSSVVNNGTINATAGPVTINGAVNPLLGTFTGTNFTLGGTIDLATGAWTIGARAFRINGTLQNGTVNVAGSNLTFPAPCTFGRLNNITINGNLTVSSGGIRWNNVTNNGTITLTGDSRIAFEGDQTLTGTIVGSTASTVSLQQATAGTLTIAPSAIIRGGNLALGSSSCFNVAMSVFNNGTIQADVASRTINCTVTLTNNGTIAAGPGNLDVTGTITGFNSATRVLSGGTWRSNAGNLRLINPTALTVRTIAAGTTVSVEGATGGLLNSANANALADVSAVAGTLRFASRNVSIAPNSGVVANSGTLTLDRAPLTITGAYTQTAPATLSVTVAGPALTQFGRLAISGAATIAGSILAQPTAGYEPPDTTLFNVVSAASVTGTFGAVTGGGGFVPTATYTPTLVQLTFVQCPTFIVQPPATAGCIAGTATFNIQVVGRTPLSYQWQQFTGGSWVNLADGPLAGVGTIIGALTDALSIAAIESEGLQVRVLVSNICGTTTSDAASLVFLLPCSIADIVGTDGGPITCGDSIVDGTDFVAFINSFSVGDPALDPRADIAGAGPSGFEPDGVIDGGDFIAFINAFAAGC